MSDLAIKIEHVSKEYRLGAIGGGTLRGDLQSWMARIRGKEDPNSIIGAGEGVKIGERFLALNDVNCEVKKGEALGIIGHNGAGKSTLLKLLSRVTAPTKGKISINGRIASMLEVGTGFHPELTGRENVYMNGAILGMTRAEISRKFDEIVDFSEVRQFIDTPVKRYSSGMYVKLAFSVAAHLDSEIMIMDEVLAVGDMAFQKKCLDKMRAAAKEEGRTVLYVSHNMNTIRQLCDRCLVMSRGRLVFNGGVEKAISLYAGNDNGSLPACYDLFTSPRPSEQHGHRIRIQEFRFLGKEIAQFDSAEKIRFQIRFQANDTINGLKFYFVVFGVNGTVAGTSQSFSDKVNAVSGYDYLVESAMDISNLAEGRYYFQVDMFSDDYEGHHLSYDHPVCDIAFEVFDSNPDGIIWQPQYFGLVKLNPIEITGGACLGDTKS